VSRWAFGVDKQGAISKNVSMPLKSKTSKVKEEPVVETPEEEVKNSTKTADTPAVPAWRAEVVEEGEEDVPKAEVSTDVESQVDMSEGGVAPGPEGLEARGEKPKEETPEVVTIGETPKGVETLGEVKTEEAPTLDLTMPDDVGEKKGKKVFIIVFVLVLIAGLVAGGFYYYKTKVSGGDEAKKEEMPTPSAQETPTPTPQAEAIDLSEYNVSVLNGSGIPGEAGKVETALKGEGFETIETSNAESYDYTISEVSLKKDTPAAVYDAVKKALSGYKIVKQEDALAENSEFDVEIIVGTTKSGSTPTPTASPSATKAPTKTPTPTP